MTCDEVQNDDMRDLCSTQRYGMALAQKDKRACIDQVQCKNDLILVFHSRDEDVYLMLFILESLIPCFAI